MRNIIAGTAGHIDHGKTALVRALTGIETDRLAEEKRRGISIDLGFAHLELGGLRIGFVDVPGHERFVKNMLAGAQGIDMVLFVVAADESIKPQTREHFDICRLLGVRAGVVVLTKVDLVDPELLELVRLEVEEFVRGSFLEGAPVVKVSAVTGQGLDDLRREIARVAAGREREGRLATLPPAGGPRVFDARLRNRGHGHAGGRARWRSSRKSNFTRRARDCACAAFRSTARRSRARWPDSAPRSTSRASRRWKSAGE